MTNPSGNKSQYYAILGLDDDASQEEIKKAYRKLSLQYHPDRNSSHQENTDTFIQITTAYRILLGKEDVKAPSSAKTGSQWPPEKIVLFKWKNRKKTALWGGISLLIVFLISTGTILNLRKRAMLEGLRQNQQLQKITTREKHAPAIAKETDIVVKEKEKDEPQDSNATNQEKLPEQVAPKTETVRSTTIKTDSIIIHETSPSLSPQVEEKNAGQPDTTALVSEKSQDVFQIIERETIKAQEKLSLPPQEPPKKKGGESKPGENRTSRNSKNTNDEKTLLGIIPEETSKLPITQEEEQKTEQTDAVSNPEEENLNKKIALFLVDYINAYEKRNVISFMRFFTEKATENGIPMAGAITTYKNFFDSAQTLKLKIHIISWTKEQNDAITLNGRFQLMMNYLAGNSFLGRGRITFSLQRKSDTFLIDRMDYAFDSTKEEHK